MDSCSRDQMNNLGRKFVLFFMLSISVKSAVSAEEITDTQKYKSMSEAAIADVDNANNYIKEIIAIQKKLNEALKIKNVEERLFRFDELNAERYKIPGVQLIVSIESENGEQLDLLYDTKKRRNVIDNKKIQDAIIRTKILLEKKLLTCFSPQSENLSESSQCQNLLEHTCNNSYFGFEGSKGYYLSLNTNLKIIKTNFDKVEELLNINDIPNLKYFTTQSSLLNLQLCKTAASQGRPHAPGAFLEIDLNQRWLDILATKNPIERDQILSHCVEALPSQEEIDQLKALPSQFKKFNPIDSLNSIYTDRRSSCKLGIELLCSGVNFIKNTAIMSYVSQSCEIRDVTSEDVNTDIQLWKQTGSTQASLLRHSEIVDDIQACTILKDAGYLWDYVRPVADANFCKKEKMKKPNLTYSECPIVGNSQSNIFHVPGGASYNKMLIKNASGKDNRVCFSSQEDAIAAGYRPAKR